MCEMGELPNEPDNRILLALGFSFAHDAVDVAIVGTKTPKYMRANIEMVNKKLPIDSETVAALQKRYDAVGKEWQQLT